MFDDRTEVESTGSRPFLVEEIKVGIRMLALLFTLGATAALLAFIIIDYNTLQSSETGFVAVARASNDFIVALRTELNSRVGLSIVDAANLLAEATAPRGDVSAAEIAANADRTTAALSSLTRRLAVVASAATACKAKPAPAYCGTTAMQTSLTAFRAATSPVAAATSVEELARAASQAVVFALSASSATVPRGMLSALTAWHANMVAAAASDIANLLLTMAARPTIDEAAVREQLVSNAALLRCLLSYGPVLTPSAASATTYANVLNGATAILTQATAVPELYATSSAPSTVWVYFQDLNASAVFLAAHDDIAAKAFPVDYSKAVVPRIAGVSVVTAIIVAITVVVAVIGVRQVRGSFRAKQLLQSFRVSRPATLEGHYMPLVQNTWPPTRRAPVAGDVDVADMGPMSDLETLFHTAAVFASSLRPFLPHALTRIARSRMNITREHTGGATVDDDAVAAALESTASGPMTTEQLILRGKKNKGVGPIAVPSDAQFLTEPRTYGLEQCAVARFSFITDSSVVMQDGTPHGTPITAQVCLDLVAAHALHATAAESVPGSTSIVSFVHEVAADFVTVVWTQERDPSRGAADDAAPASAATNTSACALTAARRVLDAGLQHGAVLRAFVATGTVTLSVAKIGPRRRIATLVAGPIGSMDYASRIGHAHPSCLLLDSSTYRALPRAVQSQCRMAVVRASRAANVLVDGHLFENLIAPMDPAQVKRFQAAVTVFADAAQRTDGNRNQETIARGALEAYCREFRADATAAWILQHCFVAATAGDGYVPAPGVPGRSVRGPLTPSHR